MKPFYKSKEFWTYVGAIITATGNAFVGDTTWEKIVPMILIDLFGIAGIIFRWNSKDRPLGWK